LLSAALVQPSLHGAPVIVLNRVASETVIEVFEIGPDEWQLWRRLRLAALADAPASFKSTLAEWSGPGDTEQRWRARLASAALNLVLSWNQDPSGMLSAAPPDSDGAIRLMSVWVAPAARGRGISDAAIHRVVNWARAQRVDYHLVLSVKADNAKAIQLYGRHGFLDSGPTPDHPDERWMCR
jgi:GNAT superfamily N-acetyltransferase